MTAFEAGFVISNAVGGQEIDEMDSLLAFLAFVLGSTKRHIAGRRSELASAGSWRARGWRGFRFSMEKYGSTGENIGDHDVRSNFIFAPQDSLKLYIPT